MTIGIVGLRKALGWSAYELSKRSGVAYQVIQKVEKGQHQPSMPTAILLADTLKCILDELVGRVHPRKEENDDKTLDNLEKKPRVQEKPRKFSLYRRNARKRPKLQTKKPTAPEVS